MHQNRSGNGRKGTSFKKAEFDTNGESYEEKKGAHSNIMHVYTPPPNSWGLDERVRDQTRLSWNRH